MNIVGKKIGLSTQVFSAMILGAVFGLLFGGVMVKLEFIGTSWLNCIKMIVVPMVLMTIITGITSQKDLKSLTSPSRSSSRICSPPICSSPSLRATSCKPSSSQ